LELLCVNVPLAITMPKRDDQLETIWEIGEHTIGKHRVMKAYLDGWFPVISRHAGRILFVDGFAGPGRYKGGEEGSPVIALKALRDHPYRSHMKAEFVFLFIEKDEQRADALRQEIAPIVADLGATVKSEVVTGVFDEKMSEVLRTVAEQKKKLAPAFVMVDPFGVGQTPMSVIAGILENPKSEVFISFMWEWINRFKGQPEFDKPLTELYGTDAWKGYAKLPSAEQKTFLYALYEEQLRKAGAKHVTYFELLKRERHVYTIFFATKHPKGMDLMKASIWKADKTGHYQFRGRDEAELMLDIDRPNLEPLQRELQAAFAGKEISIEEVIEWAMGDATDYHSGHVKSALKVMEEKGIVSDVKRADGEKRRKGTFPESTTLNIAKSPRD
jgi:three-Cys-motif partner protein